MSILSTKRCPNGKSLYYLTDKYLVCEDHPNLWELRDGRVVDPSLKGSTEAYAAYREVTLVRGRQKKRERAEARAQKKREQGRKKRAAA